MAVTGHVIMKLGFTQYLLIELKSSESQFIHWFRNKVDPPGFSGYIFDSTNKHLYGELKDKTFWIEKKNKLFYKSGFKPPLLDFSLISGNYDLDNNVLKIDLWVSLKSQIKNLMLIGIPVWVAIAIYVYIRYGDSSIFILPMLSGMFLLYFTWRVRQDAKVFSNYLKEEIEETACNTVQ